MEPQSHNNKIEEKKVEEGVFSAIASGQVKMRPRWRFVLETTLVATGLIILLFLVLYLVSFIVFVLHENGAWFVPAFGPSGWFALFRRLPWALIGLAVIFIIILEVLVKRYSVAYQRPLLASALVVIAIVLIGGVAISETSFHARLFNDARQNGLPVIGGMYRGFAMPQFSDIHRGEILDIATGTFVIIDDDGETSTIVITPETRLPLGDDFEMSDTVIVFGPLGVGRIVDAYGVQKISQ